MGIEKTTARLLCQRPLLERMLTWKMHGRLKQGDSNLIVTIIDSGSKLDQPGIRGKDLEKITERSPADSIDNEQQTVFIDDINGWDFVNVR
jgi:hypothetical protein